MKTLKIILLILFLLLPLLIFSKTKTGSNIKKEIAKFDKELSKPVKKIRNKKSTTNKQSKKEVYKSKLKKVTKYNEYDTISFTYSMLSSLQDIINKYNINIGFYIYFLSPTYYYFSNPYIYDSYYQRYKDGTYKNKKYEIFLNFEVGKRLFFEGKFIMQPLNKINEVVTYEYRNYNFTSRYLLQNNLSIEFQIKKETGCYDYFYQGYATGGDLYTTSASYINYFDDVKFNNLECKMGILIHPSKRR